jgi:hypothetical protein
MTTQIRSAAVVLVLVVLGGCGGSSGTGTVEKAAASPDDSKAAASPAVTENRWLRGLWANDIRKALGAVSMTCTGPTMENRQSVWSCQSATPLVAYKARFYGNAPGKIEYITATVTQSDRPKDDLPLRVFVALAGLHFEGAEPQKARAWVRKNIAGGGSTSFGPARFKLLGDERRRQLDIKAVGSEW